MIEDNVLNRALDDRNDKIDTAKSILSQTQKLFKEYGSEELKTASSRFADILTSLNSSDVKLVVLGEFSRGKSSLVNALLGINLLPTAMESTTAINTFVKMLPDDVSEQFIRVHFQDGTSAEDIAWTDDSVLERWGTELDRTNTDVRKKIDFIEAFMSHELLEKGLILVDTPGLQSVMAHHEAITRKAIDEAHIALWVQNTSQLGGNETEWQFLSETISNNFNKFVTVIGWWDKVLAPDDFREQNKPEAQRISEKLTIIKENFRSHLKDDKEYNTLTNEKHLIPVSAHWAMSSEEEKKARSGIDKLAQCLSDMFTSGEALEQIYSKPLQQLVGIQKLLEQTLEEENVQLSSDQSASERQRDLDILQLEIDGLVKDAHNTAEEYKDEHKTAAKMLAEKICESLTSPLENLKNNIENQVTESYVTQQIQQKTGQVGLPLAIEQEFNQVTSSLAESWKGHQHTLLTVLKELSDGYSEQMEKHAGQIQGDLTALKVELPKVDIRCDLDFSAIERHHQKAMALEQEILERQHEIDKLESDIAQNQANPEAIRNAQMAVQRAERMLESLGRQPDPRSYSEREQTSSGGAYSSPKYRTVTRYDDSNVKAYQKEKSNILNSIEDKETRVLEIIAEEERRTGLRMSFENAQKKVQREIAKFEKQQAQMQQDARETERRLIEETTQRLRHNTTSELTKQIKYIDKHLQIAIEQIFMNQWQWLKKCVDEQYIEPLNAKKAKREEVKKLMQQGIEALADRKELVILALDELKQLQVMTQTALD